MLEPALLIWLIVTAVMIILLLAIGTLAAAGMLGRDDEDRAVPVPVASEENRR